MSERCPHCSKIFAYHRNLLRHQRENCLGNKNYECPRCSRGFSNKSNLSKHLKSCSYKEIRSKEVIGRRYPFMASKPDTQFSRHELRKNFRAKLASKYSAISLLRMDERDLVKWITRWTADLGNFSCYDPSRLLFAVWRHNKWNKEIDGISIIQAVCSSLHRVLHPERLPALFEEWKERPDSIENEDQQSINNTMTANLEEIRVLSISNFPISRFAERLQRQLVRVRARTCSFDSDSSSNSDSNSDSD